MSKSQESYSKKEKEKKRLKKKKEKLERREQRKLEKAEGGTKTFEELLRYVDENGNLTTTPPDPNKKKVEIKLENIILGAQPRDNTPVERVRNGKVKFFNDEKGFGFILDSANQESVFVHINNVDGQLQEGDKVTFEIEMGPKGPNAVNVSLK